MYFIYIEIVITNMSKWDTNVTHTHKRSMVSELDQLESALVRLRGQLEVVEKYAGGASAGKVKGDEGLGRDLALAVSEVPMVDPAEFEAALSTGTQDLLMVVYLSDLIKTQLGIAEKLEKLV